MLKLSDRKWKEFYLSELFEIRPVKGLPIDNYKKKGKYPYISTSSNNNGLVDFVNNIDNDLSPKHVISVDPIKGKCFYHVYNFIGRGFSGASINLLLNNNLNKYNALFLCSLIENKIKSRASYSYLFNGKRLKLSSIYLPVTSDFKPDYEFMEQYIKEREQQKLQQYKKFIFNRIMLEQMKVPVHQGEWKKFKIADIFINKIGKNIDGNKINKNSGYTPYITRKETDNGLDGFIDNNQKKLNKDYPVITIGNETAMPYVQNYPFYTGTKVNILQSKKNLSKYILGYIQQSLMQHKNKYSYSYTINSKRLLEQIILLPITSLGEPDYIYMENYMRYLEQKKLLDYIEYIEKSGRV